MACCIQFVSEKVECDVSAPTSPAITFESEAPFHASSTIEARQASAGTSDSKSQADNN